MLKLFPVQSTEILRGGQYFVLRKSTVLLKLSMAWVCTVTLDFIANLFGELLLQLKKMLDFQNFTERNPLSNSYLAKLNFSDERFNSNLESALVSLNAFFGWVKWFEVSSTSRSLIIITISNSYVIFYGRLQIPSYHTIISTCTIVEFSKVNDCYSVSYKWLSWLCHYNLSWWLFLQVTGYKLHKVVETLQLMDHWMTKKPRRCGQHIIYFII
jgi:hypothetical protein